MGNLTNSQKSIWVTEQYYKGSSINNICGSAIIEEQIDFEKLKKAVEIVYQKHDNFRLQIEVEDGEVKQVLSEKKETKIDTILVATPEELKKETEKIVRTPFRLENSELFKFYIFKFENGEGGFMLNIHHLIADAWTLAFICNEIIKTYSDLKQNKEVETKAIYSYIDYIKAEQEYLESEKYQKDKAYWEEKLKTIPEVATIPGSKLNADESNPASERKQFNLDVAKVEKMKEYCKENKISLYNFFMAIYAIYIGEISNLDEFVIGTPILNRTNFKEKNAAGMFINMAPFKINMNQDDDFGTFVKNIALDSMGMLKHQKYSYQCLLENLRKKNKNIPNLYNILLSYQITNAHQNGGDMTYKTEWTFNGCCAENIDIQIYDLNDTGSLNIAYDYKTAIYEEEDIENLHKRILNIIDQVVAKENIDLKDIEIVTPDEKEKLINEFNKTELKYDTKETVISLFEKQVEKTPEKVAIVSNRKQLTYKELNEKANMLARKMIEKGVKQQDIVGIMLNRSPEMIIGLIAILKCGATYLPIDPEYPEERISYMLENSETKIILINSSTEKCVAKEYLKINIELSNNEIYNNNTSTKNINIQVDSNTLAYIIYTSGSTGKPKGVMITNKNLNNFVKGMKQIIDFNQNKVMVSVTTICFDIFGLEMWCSLTNGVTLVLANEEEQRNVMLLNKLCLENKVNMIQTTPSRFSVIFEEEKNIEFMKNITEILVGGEAISNKLLIKMQKNASAKIFNMYGPTETTIWSTVKELTKSKEVTIGKPICNTQCYILNKNHKLLPIGIRGELYIGGDGVTNGYLKREELTREKFISSPFREKENIYNTNDLAYYKENGEIVHLGRTDFQVKIRGYRIELGEIENCIEQNKNIIQSVVVKRNISNNHDILVAYYTSKGNKEIDEELRKTLLEKLPQYMVPQYFIKLEKMPYTLNGKIDKKALPDFNSKTTNKEIVKPRNKTDEELITILEKMLNIKQISITDTLTNIGGDSLSAITLSTKILSKYNVQLDIKDILSNLTIKDISDYIIKNKDKEIKVTKIEQVAERETYPLSSAQKRIYFNAKMIGEMNTVYNMPGAILVDEILDKDKVEKVFNEIIDRHEVLRTKFILQNEDVVQKIEKNINFAIKVYENTEEEIKEIMNKFSKPFDFEKAPLLRVELHYINKTKTLVLIDTHHIIMDGTGLNNLIIEFNKLYNEESLPKQLIQYKDYAVWENNYNKSENLKKYEDYWINKFNDCEFTQLNLPYDYQLTETRNYEGRKFSKVIDKNYFSEIEKYAKKLNVSPYVLFISAFYILLNKYTEQTDITIGTPIANRDIEETKGMLGMFVNNIVTRGKIRPNETFREFLYKMKEQILNDLSNQPYPFDMLVKKLGIPIDNSKNPLFDVMFTYQNEEEDTISIGNKKCEILEIDNKISKFNLSLEIKPKTHTINIEYCTNLFKLKTIEDLFENYIEIINYIISDINVKIEDITIISSKKKIIERNDIKEMPNTRHSIDLELEKQLCDILKKILQVGNIESTDNFFEIGVDSITAMRLQVEANAKKLNIKYSDIFKYPTIRKLAPYVQRDKKYEIIKKIEEAEFYPISSAQKRTYLTSSMDSNSGLYNINGGIIMDEMPDVQKLEKSINKVIERHETLRTYFEVIYNGEIVQKIKNTLKIKVEIEDAESEEIEDIFDTHITKFDLNKGPLLKCYLFKLKNGKILFMFDIHHIIFDGNSINIFLNEVLDIYNDKNVEELTLSYKDYAVWEMEQIKKDTYIDSKNYWKNKFADDIPILNIPTTYTRPMKKTYKGNTYKKTISKQLSDKIENLARKNNVTSYMIMLTAYYILLYKYTGQQDIIVGTPVSGRVHEELEQLIGMFVNPLPLRQQISSEDSFTKLLDNVKTNCVECFAHQEYPFDALVNELNLTKDASRNPLYDTMFIYQNNMLKNARIEEMNAEYYIPKSKTSKLDISLEVFPKENNIELCFEYWTELFDAKFINRFAKHYCNILQKISENPEIAIKDVIMLDETEKNKILYEFNNTDMKYDKQMPIIKYFEKMAEKNPEQIAICFENQKITYKELNEKANSIAYLLRKNNIKNDSIVGIIQKRSIEMIIAMLAVMKSGGCYIPIDPSYPDERIEYMLKNSNVEILLADINQLDKIENNKKTIDISLKDNKIYNENKNNLENISKPEDLAYLIYTSGSTGLPKGVMQTQKCLSNFYNSMIKQIPYLNDKKQHRVISTTTVSFDVFVFETIISLTKGLTVYMTNDYEQKMTSELERIINENEIDIIHTTPSVMQIHLDNIQDNSNIKTLKYVMLAGEQLSKLLVDRIKKVIPDVNIYNGYGPSETFYCTIRDVTNLNNITIGKPINNTRIYILDKDKNICPIGNPGELYVAGDGLGRGYNNNEKATNEKFIQDIFYPNEKMYKTGDLATYLDNGELCCLGRVDNQIKIRGLRVELDEIEKNILKYPNIDKCIISAQEDNNKRQYIVAYLTVTDRISINKLRAYLKNILPQYMLPSYFLILDKIPYLNNGKVNKKVLPKPKYEKSEEEKALYVAPMNKTEFELVNVFQKLLSISPIGIDDNFFELGGDSLLAMNLQVELLKLNYKITYSDVFLNPTIRELEKVVIDNKKKKINYEVNLDELKQFKEVLKNNCKMPEKLDKKNMKNILITGTTGFLGVHVLKEFLEKEQGKAYCIIRSEHGINAKEKIKKNLHFYFGNIYDKLIDDRIIIVKSNITEENLGLEESQIKEIFKDISIVVNCAAKVAHYGNYNDFKKINIDVVEKLMKLCLKYKRRFYQVSTEGVIGELFLDQEKLDSIGSTKIFKESDLYVRQPLDNVYIRSKFEAEKVVIKYILQGLDGYILRVGNLMNRNSDGKFQSNVDENAYISRLISYTKIGYISDYVANTDMELTPVDACAEAIIKIIQYPSKDNRIFHVVDNNYIQTNEFIEILKRYINLKIVTEEEFTNQINKLYKKKNSSDILSGILRDFDSDGKLLRETKIKFNCDFTVDYLKRTGFNWPEINEEYIMKFLKYFKENGYI